MGRPALDAIDAIEVYCGQGLPSTVKVPVLSTEEKRIMDVLSIRIGQMTVKEVADLRGVHWRRVYEWIDQLDGRIAAMIEAARRRRRTGVEMN